MNIPIEDVVAGRGDFSDIERLGRKRLPPLHPGEVLREEFLRPFGMSAYALAKALHVPLTRITAILAGERAVSADTALRLARFFGTTPEFWINLQGAHDLEVARCERGTEIAAEVLERAHVDDGAHHQRRAGSNGPVIRRRGPADRRTARRAHGHHHRPG